MDATFKLIPAIGLRLVSEVRLTDVAAWWLRRCSVRPLQCIEHQFLFADKLVCFSEVDWGILRRLLLGLTAVAITNF